MRSERPQEETPPVNPAEFGNEAMGGSRVCMRTLMHVGHVGNHLREYDLNVLGRRVGNIALNADQIVLCVQVRIVVAKVMMASETSKGRVEGYHV